MQDWRNGQGRRSWVFSGRGDKTLGDVNIGAPQLKKLLSSSANFNHLFYKALFFYYY